MIDDLQIFEAANRANRLKNIMNPSPVSADAIFMAIILGKRSPGRPRSRQMAKAAMDPPDWFTETVAQYQGRSVEIKRFVVLAGRFPAPLTERMAIGRWLRASGRMPRKCGGKQLFDL